MAGHHARRRPPRAGSRRAGRRGARRSRPRRGSRSGSKEVGDREHDVLEQGEPDFLVGAGGNREVDRVALALAGPEVRRGAAARVDPGLVDADEEDVGAPAERLGGAVAVVDVPVEDEHALGPELADRQLGGDRDVVEEAEAHRPPRFGVVAGGAQRAEADPVLAAQQRPRHRAGASGGVQGGPVGGLADEGVGVDGAAVRRGRARGSTRCGRGGGSAPARCSSAAGASRRSIVRPLALTDRALDRDQPLGSVRVRRASAPSGRARDRRGGCSRARPPTIRPREGHGPARVA